MKHSSTNKDEEMARVEHLLRDAALWEPKDAPPAHFAADVARATRPRPFLRPLAFLIRPLPLAAALAGAAAAYACFAALSAAPPPTKHLAQSAGQTPPPAPHTSPRVSGQKPAPQQKGSGAAKKASGARRAPAGMPRLRSPIPTVGPRRMLAARERRRSYIAGRKRRPSAVRPVQKPVPAPTDTPIWQEETVQRVAYGVLAPAVVQGEDGDAPVALHMPLTEAEYAQLTYEETETTETNP